MGDIKVTQFNQDCERAEFEVNKQVFFQVQRAGIVEVSQLIIGGRVALQRMRIEEHTSEWEIPGVYKEHLLEKEQELADAISADNNKKK